MAHLVLIETTGNQRYIFSTNRLREIAGASELIFRVGTSELIDAIDKIFGNENSYAQINESKSTKERVEKLIEIGSGGALKKYGVEIIISTSGKALLLVNEKEIGEEIVWRVSGRVLRDFPGLSVLGIMGGSFDAENCTKEEAHDKIQEIHRDIEKLKGTLPLPLARFPTLPFFRPCDSSDLPAQESRSNDKDPADNGVFSRSVLKKREVRLSGIERIGADIGIKNLAESPKVLDIQRQRGELDWSAIVHVDGNGFGKLFQQFANQPGMKNKSSGRDYFDLLRRFSCSLELCGLQAFKQAIEKSNLKLVRHKNKNCVPIVPLVLGGDDLTVVMDGREALKFTVAYQKAFETATIATDHDGVSNAIYEVTKGKTLGSGAGVAIVKPHYPFHRAYHLAESLISSAKRSKSMLDIDTSAVSAMDFHILFDNGATNLDEIREQMIVRNGEQKESLTLRPYIVSGIDPSQKKSEIHDWAAPRLWKDLQCNAQKLVQAMDPAQSGGEEPIPSSQLHMLREALFEGQGVAEARFDLIKNRYRSLETGLYVENGETEEASMMPATWLLDAMELIEIEKLYQSGETS